MSDPHAWRDRAECAGVEVELFFPDTQGNRHGRPHPEVEQAKAYCRRCPVRGECLQDALDVGDRYGIRGGMDADERRQLRIRIRHLLGMRVTA